MATAGEIASQALKRILVEADEAPLESSEYADFLDAMNNYMAALKADGYDLGYTPVSSVADEVTVPGSVLRALVANLAIEVHADYGGQITDSLAKQATEGYRTLLRVGKATKDAVIPTNLPTGSGSTWGAYGTYGGADQLDIKASIYESVTTSFSAVDTKTRVAGWWKGHRLTGALLHITGKIYNDEPFDRYVTYTFNGRATGDSSYAFTLLRNGEESIASVQKALSSSPSDVSITASFQLHSGDWIELHVEDLVGTNDLVMTSGRVSLD